MGFLDFLFHRDEDYEEQEIQDEGSEGAFPRLRVGMSLTVLMQDGETLLDGKVTAFDESSVTLERLPGELSFRTCPVGTPVSVKGCNEMIEFGLSGDIEESSRISCKVKDLKVIEIPNKRRGFRLRINTPVLLYRQEDKDLRYPEEGTLVDISTGGACVESEYIHEEDEVLRIQVKLEEYQSMSFLGQIIRASKHGSGMYSYGILFAQLREDEMAQLNRVLYNIQVGNRSSWGRNDQGGWSN